MAYLHVHVYRHIALLIYFQVHEHTCTLASHTSHYIPHLTTHTSLYPTSHLTPLTHHYIPHHTSHLSHRYCVLKGHQLFYYGQMHHTTAYGVMNLQGYSVAMGDTKDKKFYFEARPPGGHLRTYYLYSESAAERERWVEGLHI